LAKQVNNRVKLKNLGISTIHLCKKRAHILLKISPTRRAEKLCKIGTKGELVKSETQSANLLSFCKHDFGHFTLPAVQESDAQT